IAFPEEKPDEEKGQKRDQRDLENALQSRRVLPQRPMLNVYTHPIFYQHDTGEGHPENAARIDAAVEGVRRAGLSNGMVREPNPHPDTERIIAKVHSADYQQELEEACRGGYKLFHSLDNPISSQTFAAARAAVSTTLRAADDMMSSGNRAFVIARP